jgi:hypothetical protein
VTEQNFWKGLALALIGAFVAGVLWSMWTETLAPLIHLGDTVAVARHTIGLPLLLIGVGVFAWGGLRFTARMTQVLNDEAFQDRAILIREEKTGEAVEAARRANWQSLWRSWQPGLAWMVMGLGVMALGSAIVNG